MALLTWAATRVTFLLIGAYSFRFNGQSVPWAAMWVQWDATFYLNIADHGYQAPTVVTGQETGQSNINFFPLMPIATAFVHLLVPSIAVSGLIASNLLLVVATIMLHRMAAERLGQGAADWSVLSLMLLPGSFALSSPLSEACFVAVSVSAAFLVRRRRIVAGAGIGAFLTVARWTGILQGLGFALDWLIARLRGEQASYSQLLCIALVPLPLLIFLLYMLHLTGDGFATLHSNFAFWQQRFGWPFQSLWLFATTDQPRLQVQSVVMDVLVLLTLSQARRFSPGELFFALASLASFASSDSASPSLIRYTIGLYPVHLAVGALCAQHTALRVLLLCLALINAALAVYWFHGSDVYI
jgi:hypothetical protein